MKLTTALSYPSQYNPLDIAEEVVTANDWSFNRSDDDELVVELEGRWTDYHLYFLWREELGALYFSLSFDARVPASKRKDAYELLALVNEKLWVGHFDLISDDDCLVYRHTLPLRGAEGVTVEQFEDLVDAALAETERFYPAFQYLIWGGKNARESIQVAMFETIGDA